jgi:acyl-CoA dehydrogenase
LLAEVRQIAADVVGPAAGEVDREGRFPKESFDALRTAKLLSALIPERHGGAGCTGAEVAEMCTVLGRACGSTSMIFAMHQGQVACLIEHGGGLPYFDALLRRVVVDQRLIASATTEQGVGGNVRSSICAVEYDGDRFRLHKQASVISYGEHTDDIMITARRNCDAPASDQVFIHLDRPGFELRRDGEWDTLGMRGTCSLGFDLTASGSVNQIMADPYAAVLQVTMLSAAHIFWSSTWLGIAEGAVDTARRYVRTAARRSPGVIPPGAQRLVHCQVGLQQVRGMLTDCLISFDRSRQQPELTSTPAFAVQMNNLKLESSEAVLRIVSDALYICGLAGYRNEGPFALSRPLRDAHSARLMVHNDRIAEMNASLLCTMRDG